MEKENKTFRQLSIGDTIYYSLRTNRKFLDSTHESGYQEKSNILKEVEVKAIERDNDCLIINKYGYKQHFLKINESSLDHSYIDDGGDIYCINEQDINKHTGQLVVNEIRRCEQSIIDHTHTMNKRIQDLRKEYYHVLNPSVGYNNQKINDITG